MNKNGLRNGRQQYKCRQCNYQIVESPGHKPLAKGGITEDQLRQRHDNRYIIKVACDALEKGVFYKNSEFVAKAGIVPGAGYRDIISHPDYDKYQGKAGGETYWSHPESITKLKQEGVLR
jgi:hypothetical protein